MLKKNASLLVCSVAALGLLFAAGDAFAVQSLADQGTRWKGQLEAIIGIGKLVFIVAGFFLFAGGLFYFYKDNKQPGQGHLKTGMVAMLVGTGLMLLSWLLGVMTETVGGEGQGAAAETATAGSRF